VATPKWNVTPLLTTLNGSSVVDFDTGTWKLMLVTSSYTPDQANHNFRDDLGANEASGGSGYPSGGFTLASLTLTQSTLTLNLDAADISQAITGGPLAFRYGAFVKILGGASSADPFIGYVDFGAQSITDATLNITLTNHLTLTVS
jgi:hypothetical protein